MVGIDGTDLKITMVVYDKDCVSLKSGMRQGCPLFPLVQFSAWSIMYNN